jgi:hypothetical protein
LNHVFFISIVYMSISLINWLSGKVMLIKLSGSNPRRAVMNIYGIISPNEYKLKYAAKNCDLTCDRVHFKINENFTNVHVLTGLAISMHVPSHICQSVFILTIYIIYTAYRL